MMDQIQNCNYAIELGKQLKFSLVGIQGKDIYDANNTLTLGNILLKNNKNIFSALVWQLMRAYTLTILAQCTQNGSIELPTDKEIVAWVNKKLKNSGKYGQIKSFQDPAISNGRILLDLVDAIKPGTINYEIVKDGFCFEVIFMSIFFLI